MTPGVANADCILETETNKYRVLTPNMVLIERSRKPLTVTCEKVGYYMGTTAVQSRIYMAAAELNLFNGIVPGMAYDIASNSIYAYPDIVIINMVRDDAQLVPLPPQQEMHVLSRKKEIVTPRDVFAAKGEDVTTTEDLMADKVFSESLRK